MSIKELETEMQSIRKAMNSFQAKLAETALSPYVPTENGALGGASADYYEVDAVHTKRRRSADYRTMPPLTYSVVSYTKNKPKYAVSQEPIREIFVLLAADLGTLLGKYARWLRVWRNPEHTEYVLALAPGDEGDYKLRPNGTLSTSFRVLVPYEWADELETRHRVKASLVDHPVFGGKALIIPRKRPAATGY